MGSRHPLARALVACILNLLPSACLGQTVIDWTGAGATDAWQDAGNWFGANVPFGTAESARFNVPGVFDVKLDPFSDITLSELLVEDGSPEFSAEGPAFLHTLTVEDAIFETDTVFKNATGAQVRLDSTDLVDVRSGTTQIRNSTRFDADRLEVATGSLQGGKLQIDSGSNFEVATSVRAGVNSSGDIDILNGSNLTSSQAFLGGDNLGNSGTATVNVDGAGSTWVTGTLQASSFGSTRLDISSGGVVTTNESLLAAGTGSNADFTVVGANSQLSATSLLTVGRLGEASLSISGGGQAAAGDIVIGDWFSRAIGGLPRPGRGDVTVEGTGSSLTTVGALTVANDGHGTLTISGGGVVTSADGRLAANDPATGTAGDDDPVAQVHIEGAGSLWNVSGPLFVGGRPGAGSTPSFSGGEATISVDVGGELRVAGTLHVFDKGVLTLAGGKLAIGGIERSDASTVRFLSGEIEIDNDVTFGGPGLFPDPVSRIAAGQSIANLGQTATIPAGRALIVEGGTLAVGDLAVDGALDFARGTLEVLNDITGISDMVVPAGGELRLGSSMLVPVTAVGGSRIVLLDSITLGDSSSPAGFYANGRVDLNGNDLTVADANGAVLDSGTLVDFEDSQSRLISDSGLTLDFGGNIVGFGEVVTPDDPTAPLINNGHIAGVSPTQPVTLTGFIKGVGTLDNVFISGTDSPGFSPATVHRGSVAYGGELEIELAGIGAGQFDQLQHSLGLGVAELGGALEVLLIDGFVPGEGDSFEIIIADGGVEGVFSSVALPELGGGKWFDIAYGTNLVELVVAGVAGDYNLDGMVDSADYTLWRDTLGLTGNALAADGNGDGEITTADYEIWRTNFGKQVGSPASEPVPEPTSALMLAFGFFASMISRRAPVRLFYRATA